MAKLGIFSISFGLLGEWLHLPFGVVVDAVIPGKDFYTFQVRLRAADDSDFLPEVPPGGLIPEGVFVVTMPTPEFQVLR